MRTSEKGRDALRGFEGMRVFAYPDPRSALANATPGKRWGFKLPTDQPAQIAGSIEVLPTPLPTDLRDAIRAACPMVRVINARVQAAIAERYSIEDEIKLLRTAPSSAMAAYNDFAEDCRAWGRAEKSKIGL